MDLKRLHYFVTIAETLNITKAAEKLHMSQPPLTYQLKALEEELGVTLFERSTRKMELTSAGSKFLERATQILDLVQLTTEEFRDLSSGVQTVRIGFVASSAALLSPEKLKAFHRKYPDIHFSMKEGNTYEVLEYLHHGHIDIGLVRTPFNGEKYDITYLPDEPMIAVRHTPFPTDRLALSFFKDKPLVLDKRFRALITESCLKEGFMPHIICEGEDSRSLIAWASADIGLAILPYSGRKFIHNSPLHYAVIDSHALNTKSAIVRRKENIYEDYLQAFIDLLNR